MAIVFALALPARAENAKLQWGKERSVGSNATTPATSLKFVKPNVAPAESSKAASERASVRTISTKAVGKRSGVSKADSSGIIRLVAYETSDAPRLTSGRATEPDAETRSIVVNRDGESADGFRAAQLPAVDTGAGGKKDPSGGSKPGVADGLRSPFTDTPAEPPQPNPLPMPEDNSSQTLPPPDNGPAAFQPDRSQAPSNQSPTPPANTGQFQPILPSGPTTPEQSPAAGSATSDKEIAAEATRAQESCEKSIENLRAYTVDKVSLNIAIGGTEGKDYPFECSIDDGTMHAGRCWEQVTYMWKASAMCHKPLYFEDEQLERYGHSFTPCLQPFVSGAHFFTRLPVLPYCMGVEPPQECIYALGHYRPGSCAPYMCNPIPLSLRGGLFEAGAVVGTAAVLP